MSIRTRLDQRRRDRAARQALLQRPGLADVIEHANAHRMNTVNPERTVTFAIASPPRRPSPPTHRDGGQVTLTSGDLTRDTCGRPEPTVDRRYR